MVNLIVRLDSCIHSMRNSHLFLGSNAFLVSFAPSWIMQVLEGLISTCDSRGSEELKYNSIAPVTYLSSIRNSCSTQKSHHRVDDSPK